jgi:hypothetical protein
VIPTAAKRPLSTQLTTPFGERTDLEDGTGKVIRVGQDERN